MAQHASRSNGYTLIEAIVVVLILGMLTTIAVPNLLDWLHQYRLQAAAMTLSNHLRATRLLAIFKGVPHQVQLKKFDNGNYYQVVEDPKGKNYLLPTIGRIVLHKEFGEIRLKQIPGSGKITFYPRGTSDNETIRLENSSGDAVEIVINQYGRIKSIYL